MGVGIPAMASRQKLNNLLKPGFRPAPLIDTRNLSVALLKNSGGYQRGPARRWMGALTVGLCGRLLEKSIL